MLSARFLRPAGLRAAASVARRAPARLVHATRAAQADEPAAAAAGGMTLTFTLPAQCIYQAAPVEMVILPGLEGIFALLPSHVPTIAELKPGTMTVQEVANGPLIKYFVSGGFASIDMESKVNVSTLMACPVEDLDVEAVKTGLAQYIAAYEKATDDMVKSEAEIGVDVYQAMTYAISEA